MAVNESGITASAWTEALFTIMDDLTNRYSQNERRIILEGLAGIYVRLEGDSQCPHLCDSSRQNGAVTTM